MLKTVVKIFPVLIAIFLLVTCDNYEFPKSPYPRIETLPVVNISETGVTFQATITQIGEKEITNHGFVWGPTENLSIANEDKIQLGVTSNLGAFEADIKSGLFKDETYFVKAFVATQDYFVYGEAVSFTSKGSTPPVIKSFSPSEGTWGDTVTIKGNYFSALAKNNVVKFGTFESNVVSSNDSTIICIVPNDIETLLVSIYVQVSGTTTEASNKFQLTVPQIDDFYPTSGTFLDEVTINGSNFGILKTHVVTIGGHVAEVVASSRTSLKVKIPLEVELKTNQIKLVLNKQTATASTIFTMLPPYITSLSKTEGRIGDEVEITGENFNPRLVGNLVLFGESQATVISATHHLLNVKLTTNGVYPQRLSTVKVTIAEQTAIAGNTFKVLDAWLKKAHTPLAAVNCGGFAIDNIGYFIAGSNTYSYDPVTSSWEQKADFPGEFRLSAISFAAAGYGYSGAGDPVCCAHPGLSDFWRYSPTTDTWMMLNDIPNESLGSNGTVAGGNGYTVQGSGPTQISEYDPGSDTWTTVGEILDANFTGYPHFPYSIFTMDDRIFVFFRDAYNYTSADNYLYEFQVATGKWTRRAAYFDERSVGFAINGNGYIAGFQYIHEYNLATNVMTLNKIPLANNNWGIQYLFTANNKAYFLGAWSDNHYELWEFDPEYL
jgi:hypothetical protein